MENELFQKNKDRKDSVRFGLKLEDLKQAFEDQLLCMQGRLMTLRANQRGQVSTIDNSGEIERNQKPRTKGVRPLTLTI
jgi:hypothetical protein